MALKWNDMASDADFFAAFYKENRKNSDMLCNGVSLLKIKLKNGQKNTFFSL